MEMDGKRERAGKGESFTSSLGQFFFFFDFILTKSPFFVKTVRF